MILRLNELQVDCILGDLPEERSVPQRISVSAELTLDDNAGAGDRLETTVDYAVLAERISSALVEGKCRLLECAAKLVAEECKKFSVVRKARCSVRKSGRIRNLGSAEVVYECG